MHFSLQVPQKNITVLGLPPAAVKATFELDGREAFPSSSSQEAPLPKRDQLGHEELEV